jgi:hypothetical protein
LNKFGEPTLGSSPITGASALTTQGFHAQSVVFKVYKSTSSS